MARTSKGARKVLRALLDARVSDWRSITKEDPDRAEEAEAAISALEAVNEALGRRRHLNGLLAIAPRAHELTGFIVRLGPAVSDPISLTGWKEYASNPDLLIGEMFDAVR